MPVLEVLPLIEEVRVSRVKGKTLFEMTESDLSLQYICDFYLNIADQLLTEPEGVIPRELSDRELFTLLSDFYLNKGGQGLPVVSSTTDALGTNSDSSISSNKEKSYQVTGTKTQSNLDFFLV